MKASAFQGNDNFPLRSPNDFFLDLTNTANVFACTTYHFTWVKGGAHFGPMYDGIGSSRIMTDFSPNWDGIESKSIFCKNDVINYDGFGSNDRKNMMNSNPILW